MTRLFQFLAPLLAVLGVTFLSGSALAQVGPDGQPLSREQMWRAPTWEEWARPVLIKWQRSYSDAVEISKETGKPILVCVNMDGEIASEHYAGIRYREVESAALFEPYVCVIASVYRHNSRDYDANGARIVCPRFGTVTCGEHIDAEPGLFDQFFDDTRVAPRHIAVELDSTEMYDVYYAFDTDSVFKQIKDAVIDRPINPPAPGLGDRSIVERVQSLDVVDREAVEVAYQAGDFETRKAILGAAVKHVRSSQVGVMRLALLGPDLELRKMAWEGLTKNAGQLTVGGGAVDLIAEALRSPMEQSQQEMLISTLEDMGKSSFRARRLAKVYAGLGQESTILDRQLWEVALAKLDPVGAPPELTAPKGQPNEQDPEAMLLHAESLICFAMSEDLSPEFAALLVSDAISSAVKASAIGAKGWKLQSVLALGRYFNGDRVGAYAKSVEVAKLIPPGDASPLSMAMIGLFGEARQQGIARSMRRRNPWAPEWLTDIHTAYGILLRHPYGSDQHAVANFDFLTGVEATGHSARFLDLAIERFPDSWELHARLRTQLLKDRMVDALDGVEVVYDRMLAAPGASPDLRWYAGYASIAAAESHRRIGNPTQGAMSYQRAIAHFETALQQDDSHSDGAEHHMAMALAGMARIAYERDEDTQALDWILESFARSPESAATLDGMTFTPAGTARAILVRLRAGNQTDQAMKIEEALAALGRLDPALLELPEFERRGPASPMVPDPAK
ncbi:MAG: hypothetical protein ACI9D0_001520 [Bacteroidia bacterium]|jgi:hypothetical protein